MVFSSSIFLFYFLPLFLLLYFITDRKYKNYLALAASLFFYLWGSPGFFVIIAGTITANFISALWIHRLPGTRRKALLMGAIMLNLLILLVFQYSYFFTGIFNTIFKNDTVTEIPWLSYFFPLGISFITFQQLSYLIDVYRQEHPPAHKISNYALYVMLFPQLISGPIVRFHEISGQIADRDEQDHLNNKLRGFVRFIIGFAKKILIADVLGAQADRIFAMNAGELTTPLAWMGALAFTFQIYFDFSGYTDMALGLGRIMGFVLPENFNSPYISRSITEFWRRWHITLSSWLRDYLFMPLSVKTRYWNKWGVILSLMTTFVICGMWHRPGWAFIFWGAYFGLLLVAEHLFLLKLLKKIGKIPSIFITFILVVLGWVLFRSNDLPHAGFYYKTMFGLNSGNAEWEFKADFYAMLALAAVFSFIAVFRFGERLQEAVFEKEYNLKRALALGVVSILLFIISAGSMTGAGFNPFIYFRF